MFVRWFQLCFLFVAFALLGAGCSRGGSDVALTGRILLWHSYDDAATAALDGILARFAELNPDVLVKTQRFASEDELMAQFFAAAESGLGPDVLITHSDWVLPLADAGALRPLSVALGEDERGRFMDDALAAVEVDGVLFGIPQYVNTTVLFYNREMVETPAATLDDLTAEATAGNYVAMNSEFEQAFWGVSAFGGRLLDEEGRIILDRGGFANWLEWLKTVRDMPGIILDSDQAFLRSQFVGEAAAYYITGSQEISVLAAEMGGALGVAPLPAGPVGNPAPFLTANAILLSSASSDVQAELALTLAKFMTNAEQSATFMRQTKQVPANENVRINSRLNPDTSSMAVQARNAIPLPNLAARDTIFGALATAQARVLEGVLEPAVAALETTQALNEDLGFPDVATPALACTAVGVVRVANALPEPLATALTELTTEYQAVCPSVIVELTPVSESEVRLFASTDAAGADAYDLVAGAQKLLIPLVEAGRVQELGARADAERLQRYWPQTLAAMRVSGGLYGLPLAADTSALYVNRTLVEEPARSLDELQRQALDGVPLTLQAGFVDAFWGVAAFSTQPPTVGLNVILDAQALTAWLEWLKLLYDDTRATVVFDRAEARQAFLQNESGYYLGRLGEYPVLRDGLGAENLDVVTLPSGSGGDAAPFMDAVGFALLDRVSTGEMDVVAEYVRFITEPENQRRLAQTAHVIPANASTDLAELEIVARFVEQMQTATVLPNRPEVDEVIALGDELYRDVLVEDAVITTTVTDTVTLMSAALGVEPVPTATP